MFGVRLWLALMFAGDRDPHRHDRLPRRLRLERERRREPGRRPRGRAHRPALASGSRSSLPERRADAAPTSPNEILKESRPSDNFRTWIYNTPEPGRAARGRHAARSSPGSTSATCPAPARRSSRRSATARRDRPRAARRPHARRRPARRRYGEQGRPPFDLRAPRRRSSRRSTRCAASGSPRSSSRSWSPA